MFEKLAKCILKKCVLYLDRDNTLLVYSFGRDERTDYHVMSERFLSDRHDFGTRSEPYRKEVGSE